MSLANFVNTRSPILLYQLLLAQDRRSCASNILFLSSRSPILSYNYRRKIVIFDQTLTLSWIRHKIES